MTPAAVLPGDFNGSRTYDETVGDLMRLSRHPIRNEARVSVKRGDKEVDRRGRIALQEAPGSDGHGVYVDGELLFELNASTFESCSLETIDDDDYYGMTIKSGGALIRVADGYND